MAEYYEKLIDLQNKLRRSEEERLKLEIKFSEIIQVTREEEQLHYRKLRHQYKIFLEEDRKRQERNDKILRTLEKIDTRISRLASKSEIHQRPRRLCPNCHRSCAIPKYPSCIDDNSKAEKTATNLPDYEQKYQKETSSKLGIIDEYLNSLKGTPRSSTKPNLFERISTNELDNLKEGLNKKFDSNQANSIAAEIMNSIYSRHYERVSPDISQAISGAPQLKEDNTSIPSSVSSKDINGIILPKGITDLPTETSAKEIHGIKHDSEIRSDPNPGNRKDDIVEKIRGVEESDRQACESEIAKENHSNDQYSANAPDLIEKPVGAQLPEKLRDNKKITEAQQGSLDIKNPEENGHPQVSNPDVQKPLTPTMCLKSNNENGLIIEQQQHGKTEEDINQYEPQYEHVIQPHQIGVNSQRIDQYEPRSYENENNIQQQHKNTGENISQYEPQYDENGQIIQQKFDRIGDQVEQYEPQYDENGHIIQNQYEETGENINQYESQYAENGQIIQQQNFDENVKHIDQYEPQYDDNGQIIQKQYEETGENINQYDETGQIIQQQNFDENVKHIDQYESQFDDNGQIIQKQYEETGKNINQYDETGQIIQQQNFDENYQYEPQYDENGQIIQKQYEETGENINQYESQYDENGQIIEQQNFDETQIDQYEPQYDKNGQIIQKQYETTNENINQYEPQYDENGQIIQLQNFDEIGEQIGPHYDENGQIIQEQYEDITHNINQYEPKYEGNGHINQYEHQYDENGQFIGQQYEENGRNINQYEPQYDENGRIIQHQNFEANSSNHIQPQYDENEPVPQQYTAIGQKLQYDNNGQPIQPHDQQYDEYGQSESRQIPHDQKQDDKDNGIQNKVMDMLDTDTDSLKQNTSKISNESDFDFGSG